jgi:sulfur relay (sulfurtransferase) complex TusBCD TusD component (DsrE family)
MLRKPGDEFVDSLRPGLAEEQLIAEAARPTLDELADWTVEAGRVLTF